MAVNFDIYGNTGDCWIFNHLEKSGGSTIRIIIHPPDGRPGNGMTLFYSVDWKQGEHFTSKLVPLLGNEVKVVSGGCVETLRRFPDVVEKCKFLTMFRHPVARMVSAYFYCKRRGSDPLCGSSFVDANRVDLTTWAKHWGNYALRQFSVDLIPAEDVMEYIHSIAGTGNDFHGLLGKHVPGWVLLKLYLQNLGRRSSNESNPDENRTAEEYEEAALSPMLERVMENLEQYTAVGILEEFNASLSLFDSTLNIPGISWRDGFSKQGAAMVDKEHETPEKAAKSTAFLSTEIKKYLFLDIVLYDHALAVFRHQLEQNGIDF